jgi:CelD/BcsL family acetyltransferase involved in cellulose biosynthesis
VEGCERVERLEDVGEDWRRLAEGAGHPFATFEWNLAWWRRFGEGKELFTFACRNDAGEVAAILPLYVAVSRPLRMARFLGYADLYSPICAPENRALAAAALRELTGKGRDSCRVIVAERLPGDQGWDQLLGGKPVATHHDPVLDFKGRSWDEFLASRSRNFRQQLRRRERRLVEERGLSFRLADDPERLGADLDALFRLHGERWGEETSGVFDGARAEFQRDFAFAAMQRGWLRLWLAEIEGEVIAAWYGWRFAGSEWYYQAGRDRSYDRYSLGLVLLAHSVREACNDGARAYRFLAGGEEYKWRFADRDLRAESRVIGSGPLAGLAKAAVAAAVALPSGSRRRLKRAAS